MDKLSILIFFATMAGVFACNKGYPGGYGWGWGEPIYLPKPTLIPKLKAAFIDGKLSVDTYKIIAPSLKPLPYKKGVGWLYKGWGLGHHALGPVHGYGHHGYPHLGYGVGKKGYLGLGLKKGFGYGKGIGLGIGYGKEVGPIGHYGHGHGHGHFGHDIGHHHGGHFPGPNIGLGHLPHGPHHGGHFPGPIGPHHLPIHHTTVAEEVTVVDKGAHGHHAHPIFPPAGPHGHHHGINEIKK